MTVPFEISDDFIAEQNNQAKTWLEEEDFHVDAVENGKLAMQYLSLYQYDLVILDWKMPILTGIDEEANNDFHVSIYPNPSTGNFSINLYKQSPVSEVTITNAFGQEVSGARYSNQSRLEFELMGENGLYFVRVVAGEKSMIYKVVKM